MQVVCAGAAAAVAQCALRGGEAGRQHQRAGRGLHGAADLSVHLSALPVFSHLRQDLQMDAFRVRLRSQEFLTAPLMLRIVYLISAREKCNPALV